MKKDETGDETEVLIADAIEVETADAIVVAIEVAIADGQRGRRRPRDRLLLRDP